MSLPAPYYEDDAVTIYHGDCREILPELPRVDAVITSPPYNTLDPTASASGLHAERISGRNAFLDKQGGYPDQRPEDEYQMWQRDCLKSFLDHASCAWINHKTRYRNGFAIHPTAIYGNDNIYAEVVWNRGVSMALNCRRFSPSHEYWTCYGRPDVWNNSVNKMLSVWNIRPSRDANDHPCPCPIEIVRPIVSACVGDGGCTDPFMGSGTTLRAAKDLGRKAIGIELDERYCEIAAKRMAQEVFDFS